MTVNYRHGKHERRGTLTRGPAVVIDRRKDREAEKVREARRAQQEAGCRHRGGELRREWCPTCSGKALVKVFACAFHRECTVARKLPHVAPGIVASPVSVVVCGNAARETTQQESRKC